MRENFKNIVKIVFSKVTLIIVTIHWMLTILAVYERGGLYQLFHFTYEPWLFQIIFTLNLPTVIIADFFVSGMAFIDKDKPILSVVILIICITFQWTMIGSFIKYAFFNEKNHK